MRQVSPRVGRERSRAGLHRGLNRPPANCAGNSLHQNERRGTLAAPGGVIPDLGTRFSGLLLGGAQARGAGILLVAISMAAARGASGQALPGNAGLSAVSLPDAPMPQTPAAAPTPKANPCPQMAAVPGDAKAAMPGGVGAGVHPAPVPCQSKPLNLYQKFMNGPKDSPLKAIDKGWLAARNVADPFNLITIGGEAGIAVASDSHSPYGPGMPGYARYVGVSLTQDMTGEFFGTFLIPAATHQDPHYHPMEGKPIPRRTLHAIAQIFWTESDYGRGMPNYANLVGFAVSDEISNLYVPGRQTDVRATAERYATGLASAPIGNFVNEFLPDVASHIHVQIVILQRIINQVARTQSGGGGATGLDSPFLEFDQARQRRRGISCCARW